MNTLAQTGNNGNGQLAKADVFDDFELLDVYSETGIAPKTEQPRMNYIATVSAGQKVEKTRKDGSTYTVPQATKDGTIYVSGEAPALEKALKANGSKSLTIMFPSNNPKDFIHQSFQEHSATSLLAYGDGESITVIKNGERTTFAAGTKEYDEVRARCKVVVFVYFTLAEWTEAGADMIFNDGVGLYRMRFTSRNSLDSLLFAVRNVYRMTGGSIAGIPFDAFLREEPHSDKTGAKRDCWIWQFRMKPKDGIRLDAMKFRQLAEHGVHQINLLQLKAPEPETVDDAIAEAESGEFVDDAIEGDVVSNEATPDTTEEIKQDPRDALCNVDEMRKKYFAIAGKTSFGTDEGRAKFVLLMTTGSTASLTKMLSGTTVRNANVFMDQLQEAVDAEAKATPESSQPTPEINPAIKRCRSKIISQAKQLWGENFKERLADELGQPNFDGLDVKTMDSIIARFNGFIKEMEEMAKEAAAAQNAEVPPPNVDADGVIEGETEDVSETAEPQGEPLQTPDNPLNKAVHARLEEAKNPASALFDDFDETDPFADDEPTNAYVEGSV